MSIISRLCISGYRSLRDVRLEVGQLWQWVGKEGRDRGDGGVADSGPFNIYCITTSMNRNVRTFRTPFSLWVFRPACETQFFYSEGKIFLRT